jgi:mannosyltransferase OCH1-like enzyme
MNSPIFALAAFIITIALVLVVVSCRPLPITTPENATWVKLSPRGLSGSTIPYVLHKSYRYKNNTIEGLLQKATVMNPGLEIKFYDDTDCDAYIARHFPSDVLHAYRTLLPAAYKADLFRYCVLYQEGGIWSDVWQDWLVPFKDLIDFSRDKLFLVRDWHDAACNEHGVQISFMAALPKLSIFVDAINQVVRNVKNRYYGCGYLSVTGPELFGRILREKYKNFPYTMFLEQRKWNTLGNESTDFCITKTTTKHSGTYSEEWNRRNVFADSSTYFQT